jgi:hypothetical protein
MEKPGVAAGSVGFVPGLARPILKYELLAPSLKMWGW